MGAIRLRYMVKLDGYNHLGRKFCFTDFPSKDGCKSAAVTYFHSATQMLQIFDSLRGKAVLEHTCSWKRLFYINMYTYIYTSSLTAYIHIYIYIDKTMHTYIHTYVQPPWVTQGQAEKRMDGRDWSGNGQWHHTFDETTA